MNKSEPNDIDQIYRVLKQAGELSGDVKPTQTNFASNVSASGNSNSYSNQTTSNAQQQLNATATSSNVGANLPETIISEPDYPERTVPTMHSGGFLRTHGTNERSKLAVAPLLDVSNSGADDGSLF